MENIHQFACKSSLLHAFTSFLKIACFLFSIQIVIFFHTHPFYFLFLFPFSWFDACVCLFQIPVQSWSLNYGKPGRPFRPSEPTWKRLQVVYIQLFWDFLLWWWRSSWDIFKCKRVKYYLYFFHQNMEFLYRNEKITNQVLKFRWVNDRPKSIFHMKW